MIKLNNFFDLVQSIINRDLPIASSSSNYSGGLIECLTFFDEFIELFEVTEEKSDNSDSDSDSESRVDSSYFFTPPEILKIVQNT